MLTPTGSQLANLLSMSFSPQPQMKCRQLFADLKKKKAIRSNDTNTHFLKAANIMSAQYLSTLFNYCQGYHLPTPKNKHAAVR